ncbi:tetratricopeptide repeat protein [Xanthobacter sp. ZOL 2024]
MSASTPSRSRRSGERFAFCPAPGGRLLRLFQAAALGLVLGVASLVSPALTQSRGDRAPQAGDAPEAGPADTPANAAETRRGGPAAPKDRRTQLEGLFAALKAAPDARSAQAIASRLDQIFNSNDSTAIDILMARATVAQQAKQPDLALKILGQVLEIAPDDLGARTKRVTIYYQRDDYGAALADIREVLAREPRHFEMLYGLALILRDLGEEPRALTAVRQALALNPHLEGAKDMEAQLTLTVEGRPI